MLEHENERQERAEKKKKKQNAEVETSTSHGIVRESRNQTIGESSKERI
jgi:hypothetical protein